jgi:cell division septal protein FtsQ
MKTKVRNQRVSSSRHRRQQHLLEVTVRHDKAAAKRARTIFKITWKVVLVCTVVSGVVFGSREGWRRLFWENPDLFLKELRVSTDGTLTREQLLQHVGLAEGCNIFSVDLGKVRRMIAELPQVERVEVHRTLPNRLDIGVTERRPVAWAIGKQDEDPTSSERSFLIDVRGVVMKCRSLRPEYLHLPVISGVEVENLAAGQRVQNLAVQAALELLRINADSTRYQARNLDVSKGYCLVVTDLTRAKVTFGLDRIDLQLERLNRLLEMIEPSKREIQTVNLLLERNVPVTFVPEAPPVLEEKEAKEPKGLAKDSGKDGGRESGKEVGKSAVSKPMVVSKPTLQKPVLAVGTAAPKPSNGATGGGVSGTQLVRFPAPAESVKVEPAAKSGIGSGLKKPFHP